jgi:signal transduction histidine kinase/integral membrane sensor domain MASE1
MSPARRAVQLVLLTAVYFAAGRFGLSLAFVHESASAVWPPTGIAIAACLLAGPVVWPAVVAGAFLVNLSTNNAVVPSILIAFGNTAEMVVAVWLVRRFAGGARAFRETTGFLMYVPAVAVAAAVAATIGLLALLVGDLARPSTMAMIWLTWWTGDLAGALLVAPAIVTWADLRRDTTSWKRAWEVLLLLGALVAAAYWVFGPTSAGQRNYPVMFVVLPALLWAAVRFGARGATTAVLALAALATVGTLQGTGPFARGNPNESLLLLQAYLCVTVIVMVSLAAEVAGRRAVEQEIRRMNADLSRGVAVRTEELRRLHGRLVEAQQVAHIGSWEWDIVTNSIWWSDEMYRVYGLPVGCPITYERYIGMVHPDDRAMVQAIVGRSGQTGEPFTFEHRAVTPDGTERVLHSRGQVVSDQHGRAMRMFGVGHDITDRKRAEEERLELVREQAARREAEEASRMKDDFLATLSHELRTPLNATLGWAQILKEHALNEPLRQRALDAIHRNVTVQAQLVSDILDVARIRSGTLSIDPRPVRVSAIVSSALDVLRPMIDSKLVDVAVRVPDGVAVMGDTQRLRQVLWNLLSNAAKFAPPGGHVTLTALPGDDVVEITVEDDGPGIAESFLPYVFEQFRQADSSVTREHGGLGLGLAISHNLVHLHGGTITAANRGQGGAIFTVRLPAADGSAPFDDASSAAARLT